MNKHLRPLVLALVLGGALAPTPARAQIPVTDVINITTSVVNMGENIAQWVGYVAQFLQYYSLVRSISHGGYSMIPWTDILDLSNAEWFDGVEGIDDIRQLCTVSEMTVTDLQQLYHEYEIFTRMKNDPQYAKSKAYASYMDLTQGIHQRGMRRKVTIARMMQRHQMEMKKLTDQAKALGGEIARESALGTPEASVIAALQGKLAAVQAKMEAGKQALADQLKLMSDQEGNERAEAQTKIMMAGWDQQEISAEARAKYWATAFGSGH